MAELAANIRAVRTHYGMTQEFVADRVGVSRAAYARWESGASSPHRSNLERLADFYCLSCEQLEGNTPVDLAWGLARWRAREYERTVGDEDEYAGDLLAALSDQAIVLEAAKRFYRMAVELSKLIDAAEKMDWESAAKAINDAADHGDPYPDGKAHFLKVYELISDMYIEINARYSLSWVSIDLYEKMPSSGSGDKPIDYETMPGRLDKILRRLGSTRGAAYKWLSQRSVSRQRFARIEDLIRAARSALDIQEQPDDAPPGQD